MPINIEYRGPADLPEIIPVFPLPGALLLPRGQMPLNIFEPRYLAMVDDAFRDGHRLIGMIQPDVTHSQNEERPVLFQVGCVGRIDHVQLARPGPRAHARRDGGLGEVRGEQEVVDLDRAPVPLGRYVEERPDRHDARVVDQHVERPDR